MTLTVCLLKNINGLLVVYVGTTPLCVRKGSTLMVVDGLTSCAVLEIVGVPLRQGCVLAWVVCVDAVLGVDSAKLWQGCFPAHRWSTSGVDEI